MPKETLLFVDQYSGLSGGQNVLAKIVATCLQHGYRCLVVLPEYGPLVKKLEQSGAQIIFFPMGYYTITKKTTIDLFLYGLRLPFLAYKLIGLIKREHVNLIYANGARTFAWATIAAALTQTPTLWHVHSIFDKGLNRKLCSFFAKFAIIKNIFVVSKIASTPFINCSAKTKILYNAVEPNPQEPNSDILKKEFAIPPGDFIVAAVAILEEWKNQEDLINAARFIKDHSATRIHFFIIGDSLDPKNNKTNYKGKLQALTRSLGLNNDVTFTGFRDDVNQLLHSVDCLAITSKNPDPCPLVSLEAAAVGCAIISTNKGGVAEIFKADEEALFYLAGDYQDLAKKILDLAEHRDRARALGNAGKKNIEENYSIKNYLKTVTQAIETTLHGH